MMKILIISDHIYDEHVQRIKRAFPTFDVKKTLDKATMIKEAADADIILGGMYPEIFAAAKNLKWVQYIGAGVEKYLFPEFADSQVILTNASGTQHSVSDHAMALILALSRRLNMYIRFQLERKWDRKEFDSWNGLVQDDLYGKVLGVIGLGHIGSEVARKAKCFGMTVISIKRTPGAKPAYVDELLAPTGLNDLLRRSDFVVICVPITSETRHMIGEKELRMMKKDAILIITSRGAVVDENALVRALKEGWIAGAGLDSFETEPLTTSSELWGIPNVIITPHVGGSTTLPRYSERVCEFFIENLKLYNEGRPLINVIDKKLGAGASPYQPV